MPFMHWPVHNWLHQGPPLLIIPLPVSTADASECCRRGGRVATVFGSYMSDAVGKHVSPAIAILVTIVGFCHRQM